MRAKINVQSTSLARSQTKRRGRKATLNGRRHKDVSSVSDLVRDVSGDIIPAQPNSRKRKPAAKHSFKDTLEKNKPPQRRHSSNKNCLMKINVYLTIYSFIYYFLLAG